MTMMKTAGTASVPACSTFVNAYAVVRGHVLLEEAQQCFVITERNNKNLQISGYKSIYDQ